MELKPNLTMNDFKEICRLCLKKDKKLKSIYKSSETNSVSFTKMMAICIGMKIRSDDGLPVNLCSKCSNRLIDSHKFRIQCLASENYLKNIKLKEASNFPIKSRLNDDETEAPSQLSRTIENDIHFSLENETKFNSQNTNCSISKQKTIKTKIKTEIQQIKIEDDEPNDQLSDNTSDSDSLNVKQTYRHPKLDNEKVKRKIGRPRKNLTPAEIEHRKRSYRQGICTVCGKHTENIKSHMRVHNPVSVECDYCHQKFVRKASLLPHFKSHFNKRKHQCSLCSYAFLHRCLLKRHMLTHTGEKAYKCDLCEKCFRTEHLLKYHMKSHFQMLNVSCPYCKKIFSTKDNLKSHIGIHTGEKPFKCELCPAAFVASSSLAVHRKSHKKDNPFINQCKVCHIVLEDRSRLKSHARSMHGIKPNEI